MKELTQEALKQELHYDPETGLFTRLRNIGNGIKEGHIFGCNSRGYLVGTVRRVMYANHRLAWFYVYGVWPTGDIDHINGIKSDNRIQNLRDVSKTLNQHNQRKAHSQNSTGVLGVRPRGNRFSARIVINRKDKHLGCFDTAEAAHEAYLAAKRQMHEGCTI